MQEFLQLSWPWRHLCRSRKTELLGKECKLQHTSHIPSANLLLFRGTCKLDLSVNQDFAYVDLCERGIRSGERMHRPLISHWQVNEDPVLSQRGDDEFCVWLPTKPGTHELPDKLRRRRNTRLLCDSGMLGVQAIDANLSLHQMCARDKKQGQATKKDLDFQLMNSSSNLS